MMPPSESGFQVVDRVKIRFVCGEIAEIGLTSRGNDDNVNAYDFEFSWKVEAIMDHKLVIVESPAKAKTIGKMLGRDYTIKASMGHVRDLPARSFGVDIAHDFAPQYEESKERGKNLSDLKSAAKAASEIYLAPDPDREGEAIAWHLREILSKVNKKAKFHRVAFHEITRSAITKAFQSPGEIDIDRVDAQQARRVLDRIVGYMVSPLLWGKIKKGLSAGRVQSVALRLVCEREREIQAFVPQEYWNFQAEFAPKHTPREHFTAKLFKIDGDKFEISSKTDADALLTAVRGAAAWKVENIETAPRRKYPAPPFITSTLQQAASSALGFSASATMRLAQQLYEGVDVGRGGPVGLITYMRTDSVAIALEAQNAARAFIASAYGPEYVPAKHNVYKSKASAQGAHEAIRPTDITLTPDKVKGYLDDRMLKLYTLIWRRFAASQMSCAEQLRTTVDVAAKGADSRKYDFRTTATVTTFPGFLRAYDIREEGVEEDEETRYADILKALKQGDACSLNKVVSEQKFTEPPPRFSEATLIKELELNGIGRPSTYATIVNTIQERLYVNKEKGKLIPSELGFQINDYLVASLPELFQVGFTAEMENQLDEVEEGKIQWTAMMHAFYDKFEKWLNSAKSVGAPAEDKAAALMTLLGSIRQWDEPEKGASRTYDDKKFYNSVKRSFDSGKPVSARQWEAMLKLAVKYDAQLAGLEKLAARSGFAADLASAAQQIREQQAKREEWQAKREQAAAAAPPQERMSDVFAAMDAVKWNEPERVGKRVYDDKKFYLSLKTQSEAGKPLSERQLAALAKMASKYQAQIPGFEDVASVLHIVSPRADSAAGNAAAAGDAAEADALLEKFSGLTAWNEPKKVGRRIYDDKTFYESLAKQRAGGKSLSGKQLAALKKLAVKYKL